jgi:hypothetical protein
LGDLPDGDPLKAAALEALAGGALTETGGLKVCVDTTSGQRFAICLGCERPLDAVDSALLRLFAANLTAGFEYLGRTKQLDSATDQ